MQETPNRRKGFFSHHRVKLELIIMGCFCCQEVYVGLKAIRFKGDKAVKSDETEKHNIYLRESSSCLVSTGNVMEQEESASCTPSQALLSYWLPLETGYLGLTNSWFNLVSILVIHFHVITLGNCLFAPTQAAAIPASNYKEIWQRLSASVLHALDKRGHQVSNSKIHKEKEKSFNNRGYEKLFWNQQYIGSCLKLEKMEAGFKCQPWQQPNQVPLL